MSFSQEEIEEFKAEASDLLDTAEKSLLALDGGGAEFRPMFDAIFRSFHNLKGASGMMELHLLQSHTHELENVLMKYKEADSIPKEVIGFFLKGVDVAKSILNGEQVEFNQKPPNVLSDEKNVASADVKADHIANSQQPTANSQQPTANSQQPTANSQQPTLTKVQVAVPSALSTNLL